jgi:glycosyltransferase involved in cell wall biosynthesis
MNRSLSVLIPVYNPDPVRFRQTLEALQSQSLPVSDWELIVIDNNSVPEIELDLSWHPAHRLVRELKQGLMHARLKGFELASGNILVMVDDDNVLDEEYLSRTLGLFKSNSALGAVGGKSIPVFENLPPSWMSEFFGNLALRDLGDESLMAVWEHQYPHFAPIGAGMGIRKDALTSYLKSAVLDKTPILDRTGTQLTSGGDNDIVLAILKSGWQVGYSPSLVLRHLIPQQRLQRAYLSRLINHTSRSWVAVLEKHQINPWKKIPAWTVPFRKLKALLTFRAWKNETNYIRWRGACGMFDGLAEMKKNG